MNLSKFLIQILKIWRLIVLLSFSVSFLKFRQSWTKCCRLPFSNPDFLFWCWKCQMHIGKSVQVLIRKSSFTLVLYSTFSVGKGNEKMFTYVVKENRQKPTYLLCGIKYIHIKIIWINVCSKYMFLLDNHPYFFGKIWTVSPYFKRLIY